MLTRITTALARRAASSTASITTKPLLSSTTRTTASTTTRSLSTTTQQKAATGSHDSHGHGDSHGHDSHYDVPSGWLFGVPPGMKKKREGWEWPFVAYCASFVVFGVVYAMKEDDSIQTWALEEARRRLEKEGILEDPSPEAVNDP